ncbi:uracil-DNA glycosylase [Roseomonas sp. OT10]|nr:uracil-DNA glycosylase [Roseomonas sp. OT10]
MAPLRRFLAGELEAGSGFLPEPGCLFAALDQTPLADLRVVILGQDPYHGPGQAHGLSFSVRPGVAIPSSLRNIFKELRDDLGIPPPADGTLTGWARQGVLLLNTVLSVSPGRAGSHAGKGWEHFTDAVIAAADQAAPHAVFILWGAHAQRKAAMVREGRHAVLRSPHPSGLSAHRGFFGSRPFSRANTFLRSWGRGEIDWHPGAGGVDHPRDQ